MHVFRTELHGNVVEFRRGDWGGQQVLVNGRTVSERPFAGWYFGEASHFFDIEDESGAPRHVEMRFRINSRLGLGELGIGRPRVMVSVDGRERGHLLPISTGEETERCINCGYLLRGLPVEQGEVRCPECGRHTSAALLSAEARGKQPTDSAE